MKKISLRTDIFDLSGSHCQVFFLTKNGNQKGHECHKGLKISNFSYLMRSSASSQGLRKPILIACDPFASRTTTELSFCQSLESASDFGEKLVLPYEIS